MKRSDSGPWFFWGIAFLAIPLWLYSFPDSTYNNPKPFLVYSSQIAAHVGFALFALSFVLSARIKSLENYFGGLDKMYHFHHTIAKTGFILLLIHPVLLAMRWIPEDFAHMLRTFFPFHRRLAVNIGTLAFWGLIISMAITLVIKLPYDKWKVTHKFLGVFFILGVIHIYLLDLSFAGNPLMMAYLTLLSLSAIISWVYKSILSDFITYKTRYRIERIEKPFENVMDIELSPVNEAVRFTPGQFFFFSFINPGISREAHPYTICRVSKKGSIKIMVKSLGDYTKRLHQVLKPGATALLEGPYGRFDYRLGKKDQIWIAGGVGIAPFLSWANDILINPQPEISINMYYCVNSKKEATHLEVFNSLMEVMPNFNLKLVCADIQGFIKARDIPGIGQKDVYICGPKPMREAIFSDLSKINISKKDIHYEDFDFS